MQDWQQRVINERAALGDKLIALNRWIFQNSERVGKDIDKEEWNLLHQQRDAMTDYFDALKMRIDRWKP